MKKIGILTFHRALNYGAILQAYGLYKSICNIDEDLKVEIINYKCVQIEKKRKLSNFIEKNLVKSFIRIILLFRKKNKFDKFIKENLKLSKDSYTRNNLEILNTIYSKIIVGSDQVWNSKITKSDFTYYLDFVVDREKKHSYAASVGDFNVPIDEFKKYKELLSNFKTLSVREDDLKQYLIKEMKINDVSINLDPTLLLSKDEWSKLISNKNKSKKYILVYNVLKPEKMLDAVYELKKKTGFSVIYIPIGYKPKRGKIVFPNLNEFLELFYNSSYIITNSFHGTVFSIIFNKKFMVELPIKNSNDDRIISLLNLCGLTNHILNNNLENIFYDVKWKEVNKKIEFARNESLTLLRNIVL